MSAAPGKFCVHCGAPLSGRFCSGCGKPAGAPASSAPAKWLPVAIGGGALAITLAILLTRTPSPAPAAGSATPTAPAEGTPPDLSAMSPRERFDRLFNRVMQAGENGDAATVAQFSPMALAAYQMLGAEVDADARYHAAMIRLATGDQPGALALADTILATAPGHLFGYLIAGAVAAERLDDPGLAAARRRFLDAWEAQQASGRAEYGDHRVILERFRAEALQSSGAGRR